METIINDSNKLSNITYQEVYNKIINTYPIYYNIFKKYYSDGKDVSNELNRLYQPIFYGLLEHYNEYMISGIKDIIIDIIKKYNPEKPYAIIDFIEFIYGNILYETFLFEIKKIDSNIIGYEHLCIFEYIINVETIKYKLYLETISKIEPQSKILLAMEHRLINCFKKISFCLSYLERNYSSHANIIELCKNIIYENKIETKINFENICEINSFMEINKKKDI
jgi:hypothetical protein